MQKFTRAVTRQVEVGGVQLAVTVDERGLSLRPAEAGQPLALSWAGCLCAAAGLPIAGEPSAAEVAWALQALQGAAAGPAGLKPLLERLDAWLKRRRRRYYKGLLPGAGQAELDRLAKALGRPVPAGLAEWLRWHNGQDEELIGAFVESFRLLGADQIAAVLKEHAGDRGWNQAWVPILQDDSDDLVVLDTSKDDLPVRELWQGRDDVIEAAGSLQAWLTALVNDLEAGRYHEDPERGDFLRSSGD